MRTETPPAPIREFAVFGRLIQAEDGNLSPDLAKYILTLEFDEEDRTRMLELAGRNQEGTLSSQEREALMAYVNAGHLLALLQSKAGKSLRPQQAS